MGRPQGAKDKKKRVRRYWKRMVKLHIPAAVLNRALKRDPEILNKAKELIFAAGAIPAAQVKRTT